MKKLFIISLIVMLLSCLSLDYFGVNVTGIVLGITSGIVAFFSGIGVMLKWLENEND